MKACIAIPMQSVYSCTQKVPETIPHFLLNTGKLRLTCTECERIEAVVASGVSVKCSGLQAAHNDHETRLALCRFRDMSLLE